MEPRFNEVPRDWGNVFVISRVRYTVEPRFNEVPRDWGNVFVISRVRYIENLDITNLCKITKMFVISRYS